MVELTVAAGAARGLMEFAASRGADMATLAARSGLHLEDLADQDSRVPFAKYAALMRAGKNLCDDPALALHFGETSDVTSILASLGPASETVMDAIAQLNRYAGLVIEVELKTAERFQLTPGDGGFWLTDTRLNANDFPELTETAFARILSTLHRLASEAAPSFPSPLVRAAHVTHADPGYRDEYERIFGAHVVFESDRNAILLAQASLDVRIPAESPYVFAVLSERAEQLLKELETSKSMSGRLQRILIPILHTGAVNMDAVARKLGMSRWTLSRQLKAEGATFEKVLDDLRRKLALDYLSGQKMSVNEAAYLVGFSESAAFSRAVKRWTGKSPRALRVARNERSG